jgi:multiple sugar transport system permease protein
MSRTARPLNLGYTSALSFTFLFAVILLGGLYLAVLKPYLERRA